MSLAFEVLSSLAGHIKKKKKKTISRHEFILNETLYSLHLQP